MNENVTSLSLLQGIRENDAAQWERFGRIYNPLVYRWCRQAGIPEADAPDVVQEVFRVVFTKISDFRREQPGDSFHGWMYGVTRHKILDHFRKTPKNPQAMGGSTAHMQWQELPENEAEVREEHQLQAERQLLYQQAYQVLQTEFETHTWTAFWRVGVDGVSAAVAAEEIGMTVGAVYNAKSKVLKRLREVFDGLM